MNITFNLTESQVHQIMSESSVFRQIVVEQLISQQETLDKISSNYPSQGAALANLEDYVKRNFGPASKIAGIKYVRQWAVDNRNVLSPQVYNELYSLAGAKKWVDYRIQY